MQAELVYTVSEAGCWIWSGKTDKHGYGQLRGRGAHRASYALAHGPIPAGLSVCHRCDNPPCINPGHLFLGTTADNCRDRSAKGRNGRGGGKLSLSIAKDIRASHLPIAELAEHFSVHPVTIARILRGDIWREKSKPHDADGMAIDFIYYRLTRGKSGLKITRDQAAAMHAAMRLVEASNSTSDNRDGGA